MAKFSATKLGDLLTAERRAGRLARLAGYTAEGKPFAAVVHVEADDGSWFELDAETLDHAKRLADDQVSKMGARGASCREVRLTGSVKLRSFHHKFEDGSEGV